MLVYRHLLYKIEWSFLGAHQHNLWYIILIFSYSSYRSNLRYVLGTGTGFGVKPCLCFRNEVLILSFLSFVLACLRS